MYTYPRLTSFVRPLLLKNVLSWYFPTSCVKRCSGLSFKDDRMRQFLENLQKEFYDLRVKNENFNRINQLTDVVNCIEKRNVLLKNITPLDVIKNEKDEDMRQLMREENEVYSKLLEEAENDIFKQLLKLTDDDVYPSVFLEINAGVGGQEAMLFAGELYDMYCKFTIHKRWDTQVLEEDRTDMGGLRHANLIIHGEEAYNILKYEAGVHRVQRNPSTEKSGRIHTSTASVAVIPRPENEELSINDKDIKIETKRAGGAGGQHVNTTDSAVRLVHLPTGIMIEAQTERSQIKNREIALQKLQSKLLQMQLDHEENVKSSTRKSQIGSLNRNEKIRTYNFPQDRITDHRIPNGTVHNIDEYLRGTHHLEAFIGRLALINRKTKLLDRISKLETNLLLEQNKK